MLGPIRRLSATPFRRLLGYWGRAMSSTPETGSGSIHSTPETGSDISNFSCFYTADKGKTMHAPLYPYKDQQRFNVEAFSNLTLKDSCNGLLLFDGRHDEVWVANPATNTRIAVDLDIYGQSNEVTRSFMKLVYYPLISPDNFAIVIGLQEPDYCGRYVYSLRVFYSATSDYKEFNLPEMRFVRASRIYPIQIIRGSLYLGLNCWEAIKIGIITPSGEQLGKDEERIYWPLQVYSGMDDCGRKIGGRLLGESAGNCQFAATNRSHLLVWMRKGITWVLKHSINIRPLINQHKEAYPRHRLSPDDIDYYSNYLEDGGEPYAYPQAFHPDLDIIFLHVETNLYAWHANSNKFEEVCSEFPDYGYSIYPYKHCLVDPLVLQTERMHGVI